MDTVDMNDVSPLGQLIAGLVVVVVGILIARFSDRIAGGLRRFRQATARASEVRSESPTLIRSVAIAWLLLGALLVLFGIVGMVG